MRFKNSIYLCAHNKWYERGYWITGFSETKEKNPMINRQKMLSNKSKRIFHLQGRPSDRKNYCWLLKTLVRDYCLFSPHPLLLISCPFCSVAFRWSRLSSYKSAYSSLAPKNNKPIVAASGKCWLLLVFWTRTTSFNKCWTVVGQSFFILFKR